MAVCLVLGEIAALLMWVIVPIVMFFKATEKGVLPLFLYKTNKKNMPAYALIVQAIVISVIVLLTTFLPSVNLMYQILVLMATLVYFLPYFFLAAAYLKFKLKGGEGAYQVPGKTAGAIVLSVCLIFSLLLALGLTFVPTSNLTTTGKLITYEAELIGGPCFLILLGLFLYWRAKLKRMLA